MWELQSGRKKKKINHLVTSAIAIKEEEKTKIKNRVRSIRDDELFT